MPVALRRWLGWRYTCTHHDGTHAQGAADELARQLPCIGPLDANVMADARLMGVREGRAAPSAARQQTLQHFSRANPLAATNQLAFVDAAAEPALAALGYVPARARSHSARRRVL